MATADESYQHWPLSPNCIRLLHLAPGEGNDPFRCYIDIVNLTDDPDYDAISYVWGDHEVVDKVVCYENLESLVEDERVINPRSISVTPNLAAALRHLRKLDYIRPLWIDQLCIDQNNDAEKSSQVSIMGSIFRQARETIAWLGTDEGGIAPEAQRFLSQLIDLDIPDDMRHSATSLAFLDPKLERSDNPAWSALRHFGLLPYFERVWIVQELQLSSSVTFVWGGVRIASREGLRIAYRKYSYLNFRSEIRQHLHHTAANRVMDSLWIRSEYHHLIDAMQSRAATDQRDKMYALINIMQDIQMPPPDYTLTKPRAFFTVTKVAIEQKRNLIPTYNSGSNLVIDESWPSWIPTLENKSGQPGGFLRDSLINNQLQDAMFDACASCDFQYSVDDSTMELTVDGFIYDVVSVADSAGWNYTAEPLDLLKCNIVPAWSLFRKKHPMPSDDAGKLQEFVETLIGGRFYYWSSDPPFWTDNIYIKFAFDLVNGLLSSFEESKNNEDIFEQIIELTCCLLDASLKVRQECHAEILNGELALVEVGVLRKWRKDLAFAGQLAAKRGESDAEVIELLWSIFDDMSEHFHGTLRQFTRTWASRGSRRRFCFTRSGSMALAPYSTRTGDVMAIVYGDPMVYALRPVEGAEGRYRLLGEAYVHGIMDGEAIKLLRECGQLESETQKITLV